MSKTTALHVLHAFSTFLGHPLHDYNVKPSCFGGRGHTMRNFVFSFFNRDKILKNSTPSLDMKAEIERVLIHAIKFSRTQIPF